MKNYTSRTFRVKRLVFPVRKDDLPCQEYFRVTQKCANLREDGEAWYEKVRSCGGERSSTTIPSSVSTSGTVDPGRAR